MKLITPVFVLILFLILASPLIAQSDQKPNPEALSAMTKGRFGDAMKILDSDIQNNKNVYASLKLRSDIRKMTGNFQGAFDDIDRAIQMVATDGSLYQRRSELRMILRQDMSLVLGDLDLAIANGVKHEKIYSMRGMIRSHTGDLDGGIADYQTAIGMRPGYARAYVGLSAAYLLKHDEDSSLKVLEDFVANVESSSKGPRTVKGEVTATASVDVPQLSDDKIRIGQETTIIVGERRASGPPSPEEIDKLNDRMEQSKNTALAYVNLASAYEKREEYEKAMATVEKGILIDPTDFVGLEVRGRIKIGLGDYTGAISDLDRAIKMMSRSWNMYLSRGIAYLMLGKETEAQKDFDVYLQNYPNGKPEMERRIELAAKRKPQ